MVAEPWSTYFPAVRSSKKWDWTLLPRLSGRTTGGSHNFVAAYWPCWLHCHHWVFSARSDWVTIGTFVVASFASPGANRSHFLDWRLHFWFKIFWVIAGLVYTWLAFERVTASLHFTVVWRLARWRQVMADRVKPSWCWLQFSVQHRLLLDHIEKHTDMPVTFSETPEGLAIKNGSFKLYAIKMRFLRQIANSNDFEVWRQLHSLYVPRTKVKSVAII